MPPSLNDLRRVFFNASPTQSVTDAEFAALSASAATISAYNALADDYISQPALNIQSNIPRRGVNTNVGITSGDLRCVYFVANKTKTITAIAMATGTTAGVTLTLAQYGLYSVNASGDLTLVGSTTNDTTLFTVADTYYSKNLTAPVTITAGNLYVIAVLIVGTTMPTLNAYSIPVNKALSVNRRLCTVLASQAALPATVLTASLSTTPDRIYYAEIIN